MVRRQRVCITLALPNWYLSFDDRVVGVYYQDSKGAWKRDSFDNDGVYPKTNNYNLSQVLNDEALYDLDFNGDGNIGNTINELLHDDGSLAIYKIVTGEYIIAKAGSSVGDLVVESTFLNKGSKISHLKIKFQDHSFMKIAILSLFEVSGNKWIKHDFDKLDGKFIKSKTYSLSQIFDEELLTNQDLNDDGAIGNGIIEKIADDGLNFGIYLDASNSYIISDSNLDIGDKPLISFNLLLKKLLEVKLYLHIINLNPSHWVHY